MLSYTHTLIADSTVGALGVLPTLTSAGEVVVTARLPGTGGDAIFTGDGGPLTLRRLPTYAGDNVLIGTAVNNAGTVAYTARPEPGADPAVYIATGWPLPPIPVAHAAGDFSSVNFVNQVNDSWTVAFFARLRSGGTAIVRADAEGYTTLYGTGTGPFDDVLELGTQNNLGTVVFRARLGGVEGFFTGDGGKPATIVTVEGPFGGLHGRGVLNDSGTVAFLANLKGGGQAIMTGDGLTLTKVVTTGDAYSAFGVGVQSGVALNNLGQVAFAATLTETGLRGIFTGPDPIADKVVAVGDALFGSTLMGVGLANRALNDAGQIAYTGTLADGRRVIVRADSSRGVGQGGAQAPFGADVVPGLVAAAVQPSRAGAASVLPDAATTLFVLPELTSQEVTTVPEPPAWSDFTLPGSVERALGDPEPVGSDDMTFGGPTLWDPWCS